MSRLAPSHLPMAAGRDRRTVGRLVPTKPNHEAAFACPSRPVHRVDRLRHRSNADCQCGAWKVFEQRSEHRIGGHRPHHGQARHRLYRRGMHASHTSRRGARWRVVGWASDRALCAARRARRERRCDGDLRWQQRGCRHGRGWQDQKHAQRLRRQRKYPPTADCVLSVRPKHARA